MTITWTTTPPQQSEYATYYSTYTKLVPSGDVLSFMERQIIQTGELLAEFGEERGDHRYGPDKWSVKETVGHLMDVERIFAVRALAFARLDPGPLPGMEQDDYVAGANFGSRTLADLYDEYKLIRASNVILFRSFDDEVAARRGTASGVEFTVRSIPYVLAGHELHHVGILRDRYM
jgi:hypothetical protein